MSEPERTSLGPTEQDRQRHQREHADGENEAGYGEDALILGGGAGGEWESFATADTGLVNREVTNTPLQALTALNDAVVMEAAQTLGKTLAKDEATTTEHLAQRLFAQILTRTPDREELAWLTAFVDNQYERFMREPELAKQLAGSPRAAAWTVAIRALLNLDETFLQH